MYKIPDSSIVDTMAHQLTSDETKSLSCLVLTDEKFKDSVIFTIEWTRMNDSLSILLISL